MVSDIRGFRNGFYVFEDALFFNTDQGPWISDGTIQGSRLLTPIPEDAQIYIDSIVRVEDSVIASGSGWPYYGFWLIDTINSSINLQAQRSVEFGVGVPFKGNIYFAGRDNIGGPNVNIELWKTDGTEAGTVQVADIFAGDRTEESSSPSGLTVLGGNILFTANDGIHGFELWRSDGTAAGTAMVADINPGNESSVGFWPYGQQPIIKGSIYFAATDGSSGNELWKSDSSSTGTKRVADINPGPNGSAPRELTVVGETLFFVAVGPNGRYGIWTSDGSNNGTQLVSDIGQYYRSEPRYLTAVGNSVFFTAIGDLNTGRELWKSDGTAAGTQMVADIFPGSKGSEPRDLKLVGNTLYFSAKSDDTSGRQLWALDVDIDTDAETDSTYSISRLDSSDGREGEALLFRITRSGDISKAGSVRVATKSGAATADIDFRSLNTTIDFAPGQASADVSVDALWDLETEGTEMFSINISINSSRDRIGTASVSGLINSVQPRYAGVDKDGRPFVIKESSYNPITKKVTHSRRSDPAWMVSFRGANEPFRFSRPTYVYIHGWKDDANSSNSKIIYEALSSREANVINVDWSKMAAIDSLGQPTKAVTATQQVGETVADFLIKTGLPLASVTLIGHSLGSLVASSAAREIKSLTGQRIAELVALDTAFGVGYDIDGRTNRIDAPLKFNTGLAATTTSFTASDLIGGIPSSAGDNDRAATADNAYLVQYARSLNLPWFSPDFVLTNAAEHAVGLHNGVIGVYADLFRKQALSPSTIPIRQTFDAEGKPDTKGKFDGVVVAPLPWSYSKGKNPQRRAPKAIGWATSYDDPVIYGSNTDDVMFFDLFRDQRNSVTLNGRGGNDWLIADQTDGKGVDYLIGGKGTDSFWFGHQRYGDKTLPYMNTLADTTGYGGNAYGVIADFELSRDSLLFGWKSSQIKAKAGSAISKDLVTAHGNGIGFMRRNDLIAYVPGLRTSHVSGLAASGRLGYYQFAPLDDALFS